jgi:protocatechuate 3,4-dioxygenase beta subunit
MRRPETRPGSAIATLVTVLLGCAVAVAVGILCGRGRERAGPSAAAIARSPAPERPPALAKPAPPAEAAEGDDLEALARALFESQLLSWTRTSEPQKRAEREGDASPADPQGLREAARSLAAAAAPIASAVALAGGSPASRAAPASPPPNPGPTAAVAGTVSDPTGKAVPDALVRLCVRGRVWNEGRSQADGTFLLERVRAGRYTIFARAPGLVDGTGPVPVDVADGEARVVDIVLGEGGTVDGVVLDARNEPVDATRVALDRPGVFGPVLAMTDFEGRFHIAGAPAGAVTVRVLDERFLLAPPRTVDVPQLEDGTPGAACGVLLSVLPGAEIEGLLLDGDGTPSPGFVELLDAKSRRLRFAQAPAGEYHLQGLGPGRYQLVAATPTRALVARDTIEIQAAERIAHDVVLGPTGGIAGRVLDSAGFPVEGAHVLAIADALGLVREGVSGADGTFVTGGLEDGTYRVLVRPPPRYTPPDFSVVTVVGGLGPQDLELDVGLGAALAGRVIASDGGPGAGAHLDVYDVQARLVSLPPSDADPGGFFRVAQLPPGTVEVYARLGSDLARFPTRLQPGEERDVVLPLAPAARIRGRITQADGTPVAGAAIEARSIEGVVKRGAQSAADGSFEIGDLFRGRYVLRAMQGRLIAISELDVPESACLEGVSLVAR